MTRGNEMSSAAVRWELPENENPNAELTIDEACAFLGWTSRRTMYNKICQEMGPRRTRRNGKLYFLKKDLEAYKRDNEEVFEAHEK
jgi:hypothetical protein